MKSNESFSRREFARFTHHQQVLLAQLPQVIQRAESIDELLQWLGQACVQLFGVQVTQFWVHHQRLQRGASSLELRLMVFRYPTLPQHTVVNGHIAEVVEQVMRDRRSMMLQPVQTVFVLSVAEQLLAHRLHYWSCHILSQNTLLSAVKNQEASSQPLMPLTMVMSLFFQEQPHPRLLPLISHLMEQAMVMAKCAHLLSTSS